MSQIPFVVSAASASMVRTEVLSVEQIRWVNATAAGHECIIKDSLNNVLWHAIAGGANHEESDWAPRDWKHGFKVTTLGSGTLYVYASIGKDAS